MKSYERPRHALFNQKLNVTLNQLSSQDILLLLSSMKPADLNDLYIFVPQKRRWVALQDLPEFQVPFVFDRGMKSPPLNVSGKPTPSSAQPPPSQPPPQGYRNQPSQSMASPHPTNQSVPAASRVAAPPASVINDEITEEIVIAPPQRKMATPSPSTIDDDRTDEIVLDDVGDPAKAQKLTPAQQSPSPSIAPRKNTITNTEKLKGLVANGNHPGLNQKDAGKDLENPFSSLKKAFNREKLSPGSTLPDKNPLQALDKKAASALREGTTLPREWAPFPGKPLTLETIINIGFKSNVVKVSFPYLMMDRSFDPTPGVTFAVKAVYLKQNFNLEVFVIKDSVDRNILKINETLDFKYIRDLMHVLGIAV